jgi:hypothetical protein
MEIVFQIYASSAKELRELREKLVEHSTNLSDVSKQLPNGLVRLTGSTKGNLETISQLVIDTHTCSLQIV